MREAAQALPGYNASLGDMGNRIDSIQSQSDVIKGILSDGKKQAAAQTLLNAEPGRGPASSPRIPASSATRN